MVYGPWRGMRVKTTLEYFRHSFLCTWPDSVPHGFECLCAVDLIGLTRFVIATAIAMHPSTWCGAPWWAPLFLHPDFGTSTKLHMNYCRDLSNNSFTGSLPEGLSNLTNLQYLWAASHRACVQCMVFSPYAYSFFSSTLATRVGTGTRKKILLQIIPSNVSMCIMLGAGRAWNEHGTWNK